MMGNFTDFMNDLQTHITKLCGSAAPSQEPATSARVWFKADTGGQPSEVNDWTEPKLGVNASPLDLTWNDVGKNGKDYHAAIHKVVKDLVSGPKPSESDAGAFSSWHWFQDKDHPNGKFKASDGAPPDVIDWVSKNLPKGSQRREAVIVEKRAGYPVG